MNNMKYLIILALLLYILPVQAQKIEVKGVNLSNNNVTIKTTVNGRKVSVKTPRLTSNKYLKLVNIGI